MVVGFVFGLAVAIIARYQEDRVSDILPVLTNEVLLRKGRADYQGIVGWLYLTDCRVFFEGYHTDETSPEITTLLDDYSTDAVSHDISIPVYKISEVTISHRLGLPQLHFVLSDGRTEHFITDDLTDWAKEILTVRQNCLEEPKSESLRLFQ
jgi:hypothetical protein